MFKSGASNDTPSSSDSHTTIGPAVHVEGELKAVGNVQIDGSLNGKITTDKDLLVGSEANITADIKAQNATIAGTVKGKLELSGKLTLKPTAKVQGDVNTASISIENGAKLNGQINMGQPSPDKPVINNQKA